MNDFLIKGCRVYYKVNDINIPGEGLYHALITNNDTGGRDLWLHLMTYINYQVALTEIMRQYPRANFYTI